MSFQSIYTKRAIPLIFACAFSLLGLTAAQSAERDFPNRGSEKNTVQNQYGAPGNVEGPVGEPPITKWIYNDFTVVFEYDRVLHAYRRDFELEKRPTSAIPNRPQTGDNLNIR